MTRRTSISVAVSAALVVALAVAGWQLGLARQWTQWTQAPAAQQEHADEHGDEHADEHADEHGDEHADEHGDEHAGETADEHAGHAEEMGSVKLTAEQMRTFGIELATAGAGRLHKRIRLPGEIVVDADTTAHIVPPAGGVARRVAAKVGDRVKKGEVLAVLESAELGEAKTQYLLKLNELSCCDTDRARAEALRESTRKLLALLEKSPTLEELRTATFADLGEGHSKLVSAYAELVFAKGAYDREKQLVKKNVSSKADFQAAENAYKKAYAGHIATRGSLAYESQRSVIEARRSRRNMELEVKAADRKLHVLGLAERDVEALRAALNGSAPAHGKSCTDPNCPDCQRKQAGKPDVGGAIDEQLGFYALRAPFDGTVIERHIVLGEKLCDEEPVFTIADMSTVWVNLSVYQKDLPYVRRGQSVHITVGASAPDAKGTISYVAPIVHDTARTCLARVVLPNPSGTYRPGLFVTAEVAVGAFDVGVLVPKNAVQRIEDKTVVFVPAGQQLEPAPVQTGRSSRTHVEIVSGLKAGQKFVAKGAFDLKAKIITSGLGAHAGHGH